MPSKKIFWGWYIVMGAFFVMSINYGARYCFGVFLKPMTAEFGWSRSVIAMAATINMLVYSCGAIFVGRMLDRVAPRWITTIGATIAACGYILTGFVHTPLGFYITYGLMVGLGAGGMGVVACTSSVGKWFIKKRGLAIGIASMGISFGTVLLTPLAGYIASHFSWRLGLIALGTLTFLVGVIISQTIMSKKNPESYGLLPDGDIVDIPHQAPPIHAGYHGYEAQSKLWKLYRRKLRGIIPSAARDFSTYQSRSAAHTELESHNKISPLTIFKDSRFWTLAICQGLSVMICMSVFVHQVAYATDNGIDKMAAAASLAAVSMTGFIGQFFFGWLSDRLKDPKYASFLGTIFLLIGMILLINAQSISQLYIYALIYGFGYGSLAPVVPIIAANRFGRHTLGSIYGLLTFFIGVGGSIGPILGGFIYDHFGSYRYLWIINIIVLCCIAFAILTLKKGKQYTHTDLSYR
jgi:MFS family permease